MALRGAERLLARGAVRLIALEVLFQPLYRNQPTFWDLAEHLRNRGYALQGLYEFETPPSKRRHFAVG